jgi:hypothetical protein
VIEQIHPFKAEQTNLFVFVFSGGLWSPTAKPIPFFLGQNFFFLENGCFENEFRKLHKSFLNYLEKKYFLTHVK